MTIDEVIILYEGMAEKCQKVVDTHVIMFTDCDGVDTGVTLEELHCDDTEVIEKRLAAYKKDANDYRQFAEWLKELKQLREQQPCTCEDTISRKAVFEIIDDCHRDGFMSVFCSYKDGERFKDYIKELQPVIPKGVTITDFADKCRECGKQKNGKWIPVSESLPEHHQRVLITVKQYDESKIVRVAEYYDSWYSNTRKNVFNVLENSEEWKVGEEGLLAWRPLPEPYEEQEETE